MNVWTSCVLNWISLITFPSASSEPSELLTSTVAFHVANAAKNFIRPIDSVLNRGTLGNDVSRGFVGCVLSEVSHHTHA